MTELLLSSLISDGQSISTTASVLRLPGRPTYSTASSAGRGGGEGWWRGLDGRGRGGQ